MKPVDSFFDEPWLAESLESFSLECSVRISSPAKYTTRGYASLMSLDYSLNAFLV